MNWKTIAPVVLALGLGALGGWLLRSQAPPIPPYAPAVSTRAPVDVSLAATQSPSTPQSFPITLPPGTLPPLPPASATVLASVAPPALSPKPTPRTVVAIHSAHRIKERARQVAGVCSLAWGDGPQLYVLVENRSAKEVAKELCHRFVSMEPALVIMAQEAQARAGNIISIEKRCA